MAQFVQTSQNITTTAIGSTAGVALAANTARVYFQIQNIGVNPLYVNFGGATASAANCYQILNAGATASDGTGGIFKSSGEVCYTGVVAVGGTAPAWAAFEIAP